MPKGNAVYRVGGYDEADDDRYTNATCVAQLSSRGVGTWKAGSQYPVKAAEAYSYVQNSGYIYLVGSYVAGVIISVISSVYYVPVT